jgi:hypothetical protein
VRAVGEDTGEPDMNLNEWNSCDSPKPIIRRGLVVSGIVVVLAIITHVFWGNSVSRYFWGAMLVPIGLTVLNLLDQLGKEKTKGSINDKK